MLASLVYGSLMVMGIDVIDMGLATTPTVEMAVTAPNAAGGIILTASHNSGQWNALKLLNTKGESISANEGTILLEITACDQIVFSGVDELGKMSGNTEMNKAHIDTIKRIPLVDTESVSRAGFCVAIDCVNSVGGIIIPQLLRDLAVKDVFELYCEPTGIFPHNPEPLPQNISETSSKMAGLKADVGFIVDPDIDRLVIVNDDGSMFGEEYTLIALTDYVLGRKPGNTVSNLSATRAVCDITEKHGGAYTAAAVGEVNVVEEMKKCNAVTGGEGNGGIFYPDLHYGRDALEGIALFLSSLAQSGKKCSDLQKSFPDYFNSKNKLELNEKVDINRLLSIIHEKYRDNPVNTTDRIRIDFEKEWVHLRKSNTEHVIRMTSEVTTPDKADALSAKIIREVNEIIA